MLHLGCLSTASEENTLMKSKPRDIPVKVSAIKLLTNLTICE